MLSRNDLEKAKQISEEFFQKTTFAAEVESATLADNTLLMKIRTGEPQVLIGEGGQTLAEIQHLLKLILNKRLGIEEQFYIDLDINDYKQKKLAYLKDLALSAADEAAITKKEKELPVMPAYERRIVHMALADRQDVTAESVGQEPERRLVIKPRINCQ